MGLRLRYVAGKVLIRSINNILKTRDPTLRALSFTCGGLPSVVDMTVVAVLVGVVVESTILVQSRTEYVERCSRFVSRYTCKA